MKSLPSTLAEELWRQRFVAYEDALASFYALQDETQTTQISQLRRIKCPFGESTYVAVCQLIRFRMVRDQFVFRFATVDPT